MSARDERVRTIALMAVAMQASPAFNGDTSDAKCASWAHDLYEAVVQEDLRRHPAPVSKPLPECLEGYPENCHIPECPRHGGNDDGA